LLIGIAGRKGHGKDTVARILQEHGFEVLRFADPLKAMLRAFYKVHGLETEAIDAKIEGALKELPCALLRGKTPREAMQTLGTEWGRGCVAGDVWVQSLIARYCALDSKVVVPDVRYQNEVDAIHAAGGIVIKVEANARVPANEFSTHSSETTVGTLTADFIVTNDGSLSVLDRTASLA
jgi:hypothetical protein